MDPFMIEDSTPLPLLIMPLTCDDTTAELINGPHGH